MILQSIIIYLDFLYIQYPNDFWVRREYQEDKKNLASSFSY